MTKCIETQLLRGFLFLCPFNSCKTFTFLLIGFLIHPEEHRIRRWSSGSH
nr:MAG TPA: hypothetical protein [Caudoviricetes sp.]